MLKESFLKAIFFDLDNVLVYSEIMHYEAWLKTVSRFGIDANQLSFEEMMGVSDLKQAHILKDQFELSMDAIALWQMKREHFFELIYKGFESPQGRNLFLENIHSSFITAVVSSSGVEVIKQVLALEKIDHYFDFIIGYEDCARHKPDPLPYQLALEKANVKPSEALVLEDSPSGILAAKNANIPVIGILKDQTPEQIFNDVNYFESFTEVALWLDKSEFHQLQAR